jgi:hypothetical protein
MVIHTGCWRGSVLGMAQVEVVERGVGHGERVRDVYAVSAEDGQDGRGQALLLQPHTHTHHRTCA